jgi:hypothetical protein
LVPTYEPPDISKFVPLNVSALPVASAEDDEAYNTPPEVYEVRPVPPEVTGSVPVTPVVRGSPVALVNVTEVGVPRIGVTSVGLVDSTTDPVPVDVVTPVPPEVTGKAVPRDKEVA